MNNPVGTGGNIALVSDEHDGVAGCLQPVKQAHDFISGRRVEIAGRLVSEKDLRVIGQRPHDRNALLLAAGKPRRAVTEAGAEPDPLQQRSGLVAGGAARHAGDHLRQHHVFQRRKLGQQVMELVNEAERPPAQQGAMLVGQVAAIAPLDQDGAAIGPLQQPSDMQQGRFAGARRAHQRDDLAGAEHEIGAVQHRQLHLALPEHAAHPAQFEGGPCSRC